MIGKVLLYTKNDSERRFDLSITNKPKLRVRENLVLHF